MEGPDVGAALPAKDVASCAETPALLVRRGNTKGAARARYAGGPFGCSQIVCSQLWACGLRGPKKYLQQLGKVVKDVRTQS